MKSLRSKSDRSIPTLLVFKLCHFRDSKWHMMMEKEITRVSPAWTNKLQESPELSCRNPWIPTKSNLPRIRSAIITDMYQLCIYGNYTRQCEEFVKNHCFVPTFYSLVGGNMSIMCPWLKNLGDQFRITDWVFQPFWATVMLESNNPALCHL